MSGVLSLAFGCGSGEEGGGDEAPDGGGQPVAIVDSLAPLCDDLVTEQAPNELFTHPVVAPDNVSEALIFGGMEPKAPQEVLNYELGFYIPDSGVELTSPADLYVESIERSYHSGNDVTDWGISYHLCAFQDGNVRRAAVHGNFAHVTTLNAELASLFEAELAKYLDDQPSAVSCDEDNLNCGLNMNMLRELEGDPEYVLVVEAGTALGTGGPAQGKTGPAGIDANLIDHRINDYSGNYYINPTRLGAEEGPGRAWRYGACTYEYFAEPYRTQYLDKIRELGMPRMSADSPCGTIEVDRDAEGTMAGLWADASMADTVMDDDIGGGELDEYLRAMFVLADHMTAPDTRMMLSTPIDALSNFTGEPSVVEIDKAEPEHANWDKLVNIPFREAMPGATYCYAGTRYGGFEDGYYLARLSDDAATLTVEKVAADCTDVPPASRTFDTGSDTYFVFNR